MNNHIEALLLVSCLFVFSVWVFRKRVQNWLRTRSSVKLSPSPYGALHKEEEIVVASLCQAAYEHR
jgi:hypothetical protein